DLLVAYEQMVSGGPVELPAKSTSFRYWAERLVEHACADGVRGELGYWRGVVDADAGGVPFDQSAGPNTVESVATVTVGLSRRETVALLQEVPRAYHTQVNDVLLTALALTLQGWTGRQAVTVDLEGHGREDVFDDVDLSRTVGWFTTLFPVVLEPESSEP